MAIPIEIDQVRAPRVAPLANGCLVVLNVLGFALGTAGWSIAPGSSWWTVLTHGFAHAGPGHLVGNMFVLLLVGNPVNRRLGNGYYLLAYLGTLFTLGVPGRWLGIGPINGSSGAIFAVVAIFMLLMPAAVVRLAFVSLFPFTLLLGWFRRPREWVEWFIVWGSFRVRAWWCLALVPLIELWGLLWWRCWLGVWQWNHPAHLLGLACGVAVVLLLPQRISMGRNVRTV